MIASWGWEWGFLSENEEYPGKTMDLRTRKWDPGDGQVFSTGPIRFIPLPVWAKWFRLQ